MSSNNRKPSDYIKQGWCQFTNAIDKSGQDVYVKSPHAIAWCLTGALQHGTFTQEDTPKIRSNRYYYRQQQVKRALRLPRHGAWTGSLEDWNDWPLRTKEEVVALLQYCQL